MSEMTTREAAATRDFLLRSFFPFGSDVAGWMTNLPQPSLEVDEHQNNVTGKKLQAAIEAMPEDWLAHLHQRAHQYSFAVSMSIQNGHPVGHRPPAEDYVAFFLAMLIELKESE